MVLLIGIVVTFFLFKASAKKDAEPTPGKADSSVSKSGGGAAVIDQMVISGNQLGGATVQGKASKLSAGKRGTSKQSLTKRRLSPMKLQAASGKRRPSSGKVAASRLGSTR